METWPRVDYNKGTVLKRFNAVVSGRKITIVILWGTIMIQDTIPYLKYNKKTLRNQLLQGK